MLDATPIENYLPDPLRCAHSSEELTHACEFRKSRYSQLYPSIRIATDDPFHEHAYVVYSQDASGSIKSTGSFIIDSEIGLPEDRLFPPEVRQYRQAGKHLMEFGRLVISDGENLVKSYYKAAYEVAVRRGIDIILIVIRQKNIPFHKRLLGVNVLSEDVGEGFGSPHKFCCLSWDVANTKPGFFKWTASA